jgi:sporulation protein YlmC with PRC-barrel domain
MAQKMLKRLDAVQGMAVLDATSGSRIGEVADMIVNPSTGVVQGMILRDGNGALRSFAVEEIHIGPDAVMAGKSTEIDEAARSAALDGGVPAAGELIGTRVVGEEGTLLGQISEVYISLEKPRIAYRVAGSALDRMFGGGFYISGKLPRAYARSEQRMIVPAGTSERFAVKTAEDAMAWEMPGGGGGGS